MNCSSLLALLVVVVLASAALVSAWHDVRIKRLGPVKDTSHIKYVHTVRLRLPRVWSS